MKMMIERAWLRWVYAFEMTGAYLAAHTGEMDVAANHESAARQAERRLIVLSIQP
jgi:hypothetical protein